MCTELKAVRRELNELQKSYAKTVEQHTNDLRLLVTMVTRQQQEMEKDKVMAATETAKVREGAKNLI